MYLGYSKEKSQIYWIKYNNYFISFKDFDQLVDLTEFTTESPRAWIVKDVPRNQSAISRKSFGPGGGHLIQPHSLA